MLYKYYLTIRAVYTLIVILKNMNHKVFVIGIELNNLQSKRGFESYLNSIALNGWKSISDGCYIVKPNTNIQSSMELKNRIPTSYYANGQLFVMKTSIDAAWNVRGDINTWLSSNL